MSLDLSFVGCLLTFSLREATRRSFRKFASHPRHEATTNSEESGKLADLRSLPGLTFQSRATTTPARVQLRKPVSADKLNLRSRAHWQAISGELWGVKKRRTCVIYINVRLMYFSLYIYIYFYQKKFAHSIYVYSFSLISQVFLCIKCIYSIYSYTYVIFGHNFLFVQAN